MSKKNISGKLVVHLVGNAHLDPAWLWTWPAGVDEALATCRSACDMLDEYPDLHVTRGEAWVHYQVERLDPALFKRIVGHVKKGRWHVVNGWWIQPDCNLPTPEAFLKQSEIGGRYLKEKLGVKVTVGYNVDSFGHCGMLPTYLRKGGKDSYVFSRPGAQEMELPSNLFRWQSPAGDEVVAFRVSNYQANSVQDLVRNVENEVKAAPKGVGHTMCFYGIGDHGGGPTRDQIDWIREHRNYSANVELRLSDPATFFAAVKSRKASLPVVKGELNPHAIGCYTVVRDIKRECRRAETMLIDAEAVARRGGTLKNKEIAGRLEEGWRTVLFNQFHDIMGGSSIKSVCVQSLEELGGVKASIRELMVNHTRKANVSLPPCQRQRLVVDNLGEEAWEGYVEANPWFQADGSPLSFSLQDSKGEAVRFQSVLPQHPGGGRNNILFPVSIPAGGRQLVEIRRHKEAPELDESTSLQVNEKSLSNGTLAVSCGPTGIATLSLKGQNLLGAEGIRVCVYEDDSDAWSHHILSYEGALVETLTASDPWQVLEKGPLRATLYNTLRGQNGSAHCAVQLTEGGKSLRIRLSLNWSGRAKIVKLLLPPGFQTTVRRDATPGAIITRPLDKREYPIADVINLSGKGASLTVVSPDIYSGDVTPEGLMRLTLVRSPIYSLHAPVTAERNSPFPVTDQGMHEYEIDIIPAAAFSEKEAKSAAWRLNHPLWVSETTKGMPAGWRYDNPARRARKGLPPVPPVTAMLAQDLRKLTAGAAAKVVPAGELSEAWTGEHLLLSKGSTLRLNLSTPVEAKYRICMARLAGRGFGDVRLLVAGKEIAKLKSRSGQAAAQLEAIPEACVLPAGQVPMELSAAGRDRVALGFLDVEMVYRDIPANAWMVAGPYIYSKDGTKATNDVTTKALAAPHGPEKQRDFDAPLELTEGAQGKWQNPEGEADFINFNSLTGVMGGSIHYAVTHIWSGAPRKVRLNYGLDFWGKFWVNGKVVQELVHGSGSPFKGQFLLDVELQEGWNELMVKVASGSYGNGFWMAVSDSGNLKFAARVP